MPLSFDMSLEELQTYQGRNPKPEDFDAFWNKSIQEMHELGTGYRLEPANFTCSFAECYHLYFTGMGGAQVHAKFIKPKEQTTLSTTSGPAILMFHGYSMDSGDWTSKLHYAAAGYTVAALDCRGQAGGLSEDVGGVQGWTLRGHIVRGLTDALNGNPEKLLFRDIFLDTAQLARIIMAMPEVDETRVGATGGSQGGALTLSCAALEPKIKKLAPIFPFLSDYKRVWEMDLAVDAYGELFDWFRRYDRQHKNEDAVFNALGYIDIQHLTKRVQGDVLWFIGLMDKICPPSTQYAAYNKLTANKDIKHFHDFAHEDLRDANDMIFEFMSDLQTGKLDKL